MAAPTSFSRAKKTRLKNDDLSKKGSIDEEIVDLVHYINALDNFCTTSSCSGRIIVISEEQGHSTGWHYGGMVMGNDAFITKKGCQWLYVSHKMTNLALVLSSQALNFVHERAWQLSPYKGDLYEENENSLINLQGNAVFKFEPFILHVQCHAMEDAKLMHVVAVESGFRNSGITVGKAGKVMVAVRSTHGLEVPLSDGSQLLVSSQYLGFLVQRANSKLQENSKRITRFYTNLVKRLDNYVPRNLKSADGTSCKHCSRARQTQTAYETSETDTSNRGRLKSGYMKNTLGKSRTDKLSPTLQMQGRAPTTTSTSRASWGDSQMKDVVTGEKATGLNDSQKEDPCEAEASCLESDDGDVVYGFDLFTIQT